jgi:hypothetical protein
MENNLPPFYVGQRVVALRSIGCVKKGKEYVVLGLFKCTKCHVWYVQHTHAKGVVLNDKFPCCGNPIVTKDYRAASAKHFAPIEENFQSITLEKVLEQETKLISVN